MHAPFWLTLWLAQQIKEKMLVHDTPFSIWFKDLLSHLTHHIVVHARAAPKAKMRMILSVIVARVGNPRHMLMCKLRAASGCVR
jgi:hypothetical protein